ncbi:recombinase family protein [Nonomuraea sp. NPDC005692]|uniref:recombinase family protein n=1 Tax=Nonomuraea sp. NPDC005692 TaxID=3157168 RepID=UPI0033F3AD19
MPPTRQAWEALLALPEAGATLKFWKSDRWGRSAGHVLTTVNELRDCGITVVPLTENFDLASKGGPFHVRGLGRGHGRSRRGPRPQRRGPRPGEPARPVRSKGRSRR